MNLLIIPVVVVLVCLITTLFMNVVDIVAMTRQAKTNEDLMFEDYQEQLEKEYPHYTQVSLDDYLDDSFYS